MADFEAHPATAAFPLLGEARLLELAQDIETHGLRVPITMLDGMVLDGRNRLRACDLVGVEPRFVQYDGDEPVAFVRSMNLRRDLTKSQRAMAAAKLLPMLEEEARKRMLAGVKADPGELVPQGDNGGRSAEQAGASVGVSGRYVRMAKRVLEESPELTAKVESGETPLSAAFRALDQKPSPPPAATDNSKIREGHKRRAERAAEITRLAGEGYRASQIAEQIGVSVEHVRHIANAEGIALPDKAIGKPRLINANRVIEETVHGLAGYALGLSTIDYSALAANSADVAQWARSMTESMKALTRLHKRLKELSNG